MWAAFCFRFLSLLHSALYLLYLRPFLGLTPSVWVLLPQEVLRAGRPSMGPAASGLSYCRWDWSCPLAPGSIVSDKAVAWVSSLQSFFFPIPFHECGSPLKPLASENISSKIFNCLLNLACEFNGLFCRVYFLYKKRIFNLLVLLC